MHGSLQEDIKASDCYIKVGLRVKCSNLTDKSDRQPQQIGKVTSKTTNGDKLNDIISVEDSQTINLEPVQHANNCNCKKCFSNHGSALRRSVSRSFSTEFQGGGGGANYNKRSYTNCKPFKFDRVFSDGSTTGDFYDFVKDDVMSIFEGFHCSIITYGPPGNLLNFLLMISCHKILH